MLKIKTLKEAQKRLQQYESNIDYLNQFIMTPKRKNHNLTLAGQNEAFILNVGPKLLTRFAKKLLNVYLEKRRMVNEFLVSRVYVPLENDSYYGKAPTKIIMTRRTATKIYNSIMKDEKLKRSRSKITGQFIKEKI